MTLLVLIALVALVYASVGHGGASGYLAAMSLFAYAPAHMAASALVLNVLVAGTSWLTFRRAGHGSPHLLWPFLVGSVPAAFVGGWLPVSAWTYGWLLAAALLIAAARLCLPVPDVSGTKIRRPAGFVALAAGAVVGLISGVVGVGGGIFLSPLMILLRWADPKSTAAASAGFIVVNSLAGLAGRLAAGRFAIGPGMPLVIVAFAGGLVGARLGAKHFSGLWLRRVLAAVLVVAAGKLLVVHV